LFGKSITITKPREAGGNIWLESAKYDPAGFTARAVAYEVLPDENAAGQAMFEEIVSAAENKPGDLTIAILGGRGAQALHRLLGEKAKTAEIDTLLSRLHIFTQDALAPMRMDNGLSFVRDFERLLGTAFFEKVKSFTPMQTDTTNLQAGLTNYLDKLEQLGGLDIFFMGFGPEADDAAHLAYIKPGSGARLNDMAGIIPISSSILEHHIAKFKAGGSLIPAEDEAECRAATHILTLGPAAILSAKRVVQSIVDAKTAPAKKACYKKFLMTELSADLTERARQLDGNPGLWLRLHPNFRSLVLPDVLDT
jgi:6-phosphogluconolactonase/glucosamine-6-phosphate isomerase/deaminase